MSGRNSKFAEEPDLIESLVGAFVLGGKLKPVLPDGRRDEILAVLSRLMVNRPLLKEFAAALIAERKRRGVDELLTHITFAERPIEAIAERGLSVLDDDQLADLAIRPMGLVCLSEYIEETMTGDKIGEVWWEAIDREGEQLPKESPEVLAEVVLRLKAMESGEDETSSLPPLQPPFDREGDREVSSPSDRPSEGLDSPQTAPPGGKDLTVGDLRPTDEPVPVIPLGRPYRRPLSRRVVYGVCGTIAASLLVGIGVLIGNSMYRMEVFIATVTPHFRTARGANEELGIEVQAGRPGYGTVISLARDRQQDVFPKPGSADFRLDDSGTTTFGPLPPDSQMAVVVITETRSSEAVRKALSGKDYRAGDFTQLQRDLVKTLSKRGVRWASVGIADIRQSKKP